jgi:hypothetical protein
VLLETCRWIAAALTNTLQLQWIEDEPLHAHLLQHEATIITETGLDIGITSSTPSCSSCYVMLPSSACPSRVYAISPALCLLACQLEAKQCMMTVKPRMEHAGLHAAPKRAAGDATYSVCSGLSQYSTFPGFQPDPCHILKAPCMQPADNEEPSTIDRMRVLANPPECPSSLQSCCPVSSTNQIHCW